jgi:hypothetical protein
MTASSTSRAERLYRALLNAYPAVFRREYGDLMAQHFSDCYRLATQEQRTSGIPLFWLRTLGDLLHSAALERIATVRSSGLWPIALAILLGLAIGSIDYTASEVQATLLVLLPVGFLFGLAAPRRAWRWALLLGLAIPVVHVAGHMLNIRPPYKDMVIASLLALIPAFLAVYCGAAARWILQAFRGTPPGMEL